MTDVFLCFSFQLDAVLNIICTSALSLTAASCIAGTEEDNVQTPIRGSPVPPSYSAVSLILSYRFHEITGHPAERPLEEWATEVSDRDLPELLRMQGEIANGSASGSLQFQYRNGRWVQLEVRDLPLSSRRRER